MTSIQYKCPYLDAAWVRVHSCEITVQQMWRLLRRQPPPLVEEETPIPNTYTVLERTQIRSWVPKGLGTKNDYAGEDQQQFTRPDWNGPLNRNKTAVSQTPPLVQDVAPFQNM
jgi:hypothetical protein